MAAPQPGGGPEPHPTGGGALIARLYNALKHGDLAAARAALAASADAAAQLEFEEPAGPWPTEPPHGTRNPFGGAPSDEEEDESATVSVGMLWAAALGDCATAVPLLLEAGAQVTLRDINQAIEAGSPGVLAALLAAAQPRAPGGDGGLDWPEPECACPLWSAMRWAGKHGLRRSAAMVEALLAAGYDPVTYESACETDGDACYTFEDYCPAELWSRGDNNGSHYSLSWHDIPPDGQLMPLWELICAGPPAWSPVTHANMPPAFKAAARALLLAAHRSAGAGAKAGMRTRRSRARQQGVAALGMLPPPVLQHILGLAAAPRSVWMPLGE